MEKKSKPTKQLSALSKFYLLAYNSLEAIGWSLLLLKLITYYAEGDIQEPLYERVKWYILILPNSAILEVLHAATGLVPSNPVVTFQQFYGRFFNSCGIILAALAAKESIGFPIVVFAWSAAEVVRYSFYALSLVNALPYFVLWLRYSMFLVLFPLGLFGELFLMYVAQQEFGKTGSWSLQLPNPINFTFYYQYLIIAHMVLLATGFPGLFFHMVAQRKKYLGNTTQSKKIK